MLESYPVYKVILEDRRDCCSKRMEGVSIRIGDTDANSMPSDANPLCYEVTTPPVTPTSEFLCPDIMHGRYVLARKHMEGHFSINEVRIFTYP